MCGQGESWMDQMTLSLYYFKVSVSINILMSFRCTEPDFSGFNFRVKSKNV